MMSFRHQQTARRGHERSRQEKLELDTELRIGGEHRAGDHRAMPVAITVKTCGAVSQRR